MDGFQIPVASVAGEYNLLISNVQLVDDAEFGCQIGATASSDGVLSEKATLTVLGESLQLAILVVLLGVDRRNHQGDIVFVALNLTTFCGVRNCPLNDRVACGP